MSASKRLLEAILGARGKSLSAPSVSHEHRAQSMNAPTFTMIGADESALALYGQALVEWHGRRVEASFNGVEFREEAPRLTAFQQPRMTTPGF